MIPKHFHLSFCYHHHRHYLRKKIFADFKSLTSLMKQVSMKIVNNGGLVRSIQNHGIRQFPHRVKAKHPDFTTGQRYYEKGRYISVYYDANPGTLRDIEMILEMNDEVLRKTHLKARSKLDYITIQKPTKNPYVLRVLEDDARKKANLDAEELAIASSISSTDNVVEDIIESMKQDS